MLCIPEVLINDDFLPRNGEKRAPFPGVLKRKIATSLFLCILILQINILEIFDANTLSYLREIFTTEFKIFKGRLVKKKVSNVLKQGKYKDMHLWQMYCVWC